MDEERVRELPDLTLEKISKQDLYTLSIDDLKERIASLKSEIARCEKALGDRNSSRSAADKLFKF